MHAPPPNSTLLRFGLWRQAANRPLDGSALCESLLVSLFVVVVVVDLCVCLLKAFPSAGYPCWKQLEGV